MRLGSQALNSRSGLYFSMRAFTDTLSLRPPVPPEILGRRSLRDLLRPAERPVCEYHQLQPVPPGISLACDHRRRLSDSPVPTINTFIFFLQTIIFYKHTLLLYHINCAVMRSTTLWKSFSFPLKLWYYGIGARPSRNKPSVRPSEVSDESRKRLYL